MKVNRFKRPDRKTSPWGCQYRQADGSRKSEFFATKVARDRAANDLEKSFQKNGTGIADVDMDEWRTWQRVKELLAGADPIEAVQFYLEHNRPVTITFEEARDAYLEHLTVVQAAEDSIRHKRNALKVLGGVCDDPLRVTVEVLQPWFNECEFALETKHNYKKYWRTFFGYCREKGWMGKNPAQGVALADVERSEPSILSVADAKKLLEASWRIDRGACARMALEMFAGFRNSQAGRIHYADIDFANKGLLIRAQRSTKHERRDYRQGMPDTVWSYLEAVTKDEFEMSLVSFKHRKRFCTVGSGVSFPPNVLRKSFTTYHVALLGSANTTQVLLGHRGSSTVLWEHYRGVATKAEAEKYFELVL